MRRLVPVGRLTAASMLAAVAGALLAFAAQAQSTDGSGMTVAGWVEYGWVGKPPIKVKAKLDTGARNSSINAPDYRQFVKDGTPYVSFVLTNFEGKQANFELPVVREAKIRRAGANRQERPVVTMAICVAGMTSDVEFTLADRSEMNYQVLVGRSFLAERMLVDSAKTFIAPGGCAAD